MTSCRMCWGGLNEDDDSEGPNEAFVAPCRCTGSMVRRSFVLHHVNIAVETDNAVQFHYRNMFTWSA